MCYLGPLSACIKTIWALPAKDKSTSFYLFFPPICIYMSKKKVEAGYQTDCTWSLKFMTHRKCTILTLKGPVCKISLHHRVRKHIAGTVNVNPCFLVLYELWYEGKITKPNQIHVLCYYRYVVVQLLKSRAILTYVLSVPFHGNRTLQMLPTAPLCSQSFSSVHHMLNTAICCLNEHSWVWKWLRHSVCFVLNSKMDGNSFSFY